MIRAIIIAGLLFSSSVFAAGNDMRARNNIRVILNCEASLSSLNTSYQNLFERLKDLFAKYEFAHQYMPDIMQANMKTSPAVVYADIQSLAKLILEKQQPKPVREIDLLLTRLEMDVAMGMSPPSMNNNLPNGNRSRMETRGFDDDWSDLAPPRQHKPEKIESLNQLPEDPNPFNADSGYNAGWPPRMKP